MGKDNYFMLNTTDELPNKENVMHSIKDVGSIETFMKVFKHKMEYSAKLGKTTEEDLIQGYNGYGKLKNTGNLYGMKDPVIDFAKNPVYGKKIVDLRENIIKKSPEIMAMLNDE